MTYRKIPYAKGLELAGLDGVPVTDRPPHTTDSAVKFVIDSIRDAEEANGLDDPPASADTYLVHLDEENTEGVDMGEVRARVEEWLRDHA